MRFLVLLIALAGVAGPAVATALSVGKMGANVGTKIAGGQEADQGQFPWLVILAVTNTEQTWQLCDGVLVASQWVLTAAHCLDSERPEWLAVVSGEHRKDQTEGTEQMHLVDYIIQHPDYIYYQKPYVNDVGLVRLARPATIDAFTQVAPLNSGPTPSTGWCTEAGWGARTAGGSASNTLQFVHVSILPASFCETAYSRPHDPNAVCAGSMEGGTGFCKGDNGGGLLCWDPWTGQEAVSAIISWRSGCAEPGKPAVYMDLAPYLSWIMSVINTK